MNCTNLKVKSAPKSLLWNNYLQENMMLFLYWTDLAWNPHRKHSFVVFPMIIIQIMVNMAWIFNQIFRVKRIHYVRCGFIAVKKSKSVLHIVPVLFSTDSTVLHGTVYATWRIVCNLLMTLMKHLPWWSPVCVTEISSW